MYPFKKFSLGEMKGIIRNKHQQVGEPFLYKAFAKDYAEYVQKCIPSNVTPNFITFVGFVAMQTSYLCTLWFDITLDNYPRFLPLINCIAMIIYITADSVDGIHARATKQTTPFGKVLDHFIDSIAVYYTCIALCSSFRFGTSINFLMTFACLLNAFYIAEIYEKFTGFLVFSKISGACEGLYCAVAVHLTAFLFPSLINKIKIYSYEVKMGLGIYTIGFLIYLYADLLYGVYTSTKKVSFKEALFSISRFIVLFILFIPLYLAKSPSQVFFFLTFGQCFSICYLEEYISMMTEFPISPNPFIFSYIIFLAQVLTVSIPTLHNLASFVQYVSTAHFIIRTCSVFSSLSSRLGIQILKITK